MRACGDLLYLKNDHGLIVKDLCTGGKLISCFKNCVHDFSRGAASVLGDDVLNAAAAKRFIFRVAGVNNAITKKDEYIARLGVNCDFVMGNVFKHAQWKSGSLQHVGMAVMAVNGAGISGVGHTQWYASRRPRARR